MKMSCAQARDELALEVGQDLESGPGCVLRDHLSECPECYRAWHDLQDSQGRLEHLKHDSPVVESPNLWRDVEFAIQDRGLRPDRLSFPSWVLGVAVGVLFTVFFLDSFRSSDSGSEMSVMAIQVGVTKPVGHEVSYRPQWPPLPESEPELIEVVLLAWPSGESSGEMPVVHRVRWRSSRGRHLRSTRSLPPTRPSRLAQRVPMRVSPYELAGLSADADF